MTTELYCDFHIHTGNAGGKPVKMAAAASLTVDNVLRTARERKGLDAITLIDGVCPPVLAEVEKLLDAGRMVELPGGGLRFENGLTVFLGAEIEVGGPSGGAAHFGCWFPNIETAKDFSAWLGTVQTNHHLSSQRIRDTATRLQGQVSDRDGVFIIHHAFTPHKGLYGNCVSQMADMVDPDGVDALELGLSADSDMADSLTELQDVTFLSNSDAHSLGKIAREYNALTTPNLSFDSVRAMFRRTLPGAYVNANYGLYPPLGKYYRTFCAQCGYLVSDGSVHQACGARKFVQGVYDRLLEIQDIEVPAHPAHRPPYVAHVPLDFVPGVGPKVMERLLGAFGTEMAVLHGTSLEGLTDTVGPVLARRIEAARTGMLRFQPGGGGRYGKGEWSSI